MKLVQSILLPTDFSKLSHQGFAHALRIAVATRSRLHLLHVGSGDKEGGDGFPQVRAALTQWGFINEDDPAAAIADKLGIMVLNDTVGADEPVQGIVSFLDRHAFDLVVMVTHGREGFERLTKGSVAESVFRRSPAQALFITPRARGFVSEVSGVMSLRRVLIPIDHKPLPARAVEDVRRFTHALTGSVAVLTLLHVGAAAPTVFSTARELEYPEPVIVRSGNVVDAIVTAAEEFDVDLIAMPTAGHHGIFDAFRGSTTERVLRRAPCPVLALPA